MIPNLNPVMLTMLLPALELELLSVSVENDTVGLELKSGGDLIKFSFRPDKFKNITPGPITFKSLGQGKLSLDRGGTMMTGSIVSVSEAAAYASYKRR